MCNFVRRAVSKFLCLCGYVIRDQTDNLPYKADYYTDQDWEAVWGQIIAEAIKAVKTGWSELRAKIQKDHPRTFPDGREVETYIGDSVNSISAAYGHMMYECEQCGRLWLRPNPHANEYVSYLPETDTRGVLRSHRAQPKTEDSD